MVRKWLLFFGLCTLYACVYDIPPPGANTLSGTVMYNGLGLAAVDITLKTDGDDIVLKTDEKGSFSYSGLANGFYTLFPEKKGYLFTPSSYAVQLANKDISGRNFKGSAAVGYRVDPWGLVWDASPRAAATWEQAKAICESLGGRLPTPTEVYRNRHGDPHGYGGSISDYNESVYLWTIINHYLQDYVIVRLNDGTSSAGTSSTSNKYNFRCVWPDKVRDSFRGGYIYGPPGDEGFQLQIMGKKFYMDKYDRAPISYNAAVRECAFYHGFLPPEITYAAAIQAGLPNGSDTSCWTSDQEWYYSTGRDFLTGVVKWKNIDTNFNDTYPTYADYQYVNNTPRPFRCIGTCIPVEPNPKDLGDDTYVDPGSSLKMNKTNLGTATMVKAIENCFNLGGHLPTHQDYMILIQSGLPNGNNSLFWTSEYENDNYGGVILWQGIAPDFHGYYSRDASWDALSTSHLYRSVYYPIDKDYNGPDPALCKGGRFEVVKDLGNGRAVKIWADKLDRDVATYQDAIRACYQLGGRLASHRDLVELIRNGLPNGTGAWLWTSDKVLYNEVSMLKWSGTHGQGGYQYQDTWSTDITDITHSGTNTNAYRCIWTNELRVW